jgi:hypothetical protein
MEGKVKVKLSLLIKHHAMKTYGGVDVQTHVFLTSALVGGEWSASRSGRFIPASHWIGVWVGLIAGLMTWRQFLTLPGLKLRPLGRPARSQSLYRLRAVLALPCNEKGLLTSQSVPVRLYAFKAFYPVRPLGRLTCRWEDKIKMDLRGIGWDGMDWIHLAQDRKALVNTVTSLQVP